MALIEPDPNRPFVNYNYTDFAEGTGIKVFYGAHNMEEATNNYILSGSTIYSNNIQTKSADYAGGASASELLDLDFDVAPFNLPKNMKGTAYISVPIYGLQAGGTPDEMYIIAKLRKIDLNSNEIEIASAQSETLLPTDNDTKAMLVKITVPLTHFKKGETLRLTIGGWMKDAAGGNPRNMWIAHDPKARVTTEFPGTGTYKTTTQLIAHIPFRLGI